MAPKKKRDGKFRKFFVTVNNYSEQDVIEFTNKCAECEYAIMGREVGPKNGVPHIHMYMRWKNGHEWKSIKKAWPRGDIQIAKGDDGIRSTV